MLTSEEIEHLEKAYEASTPGYWRRCSTDHLGTIEETRAWLGRMVDFYPEQSQLMLLAAMVNGEEMPEVLERVEDFVVPALTGNGPTSDANARFIELAHNWMPQLLATARQALALRPQVPR